MIKGKPFVKWAGGKRQIIDKLLKLVPVEYNTYYEPFVESYNADTDEYMLEQESIIFDQGLYEIVGFYDGNVTRFRKEFCV